MPGQNAAIGAKWGRIQKLEQRYAWSVRPGNMPRKSSVAASKASGLFKRESRNTPVAIALLVLPQDTPPMPDLPGAHDVKWASTLQLVLHLAKYARLENTPRKNSGSAPRAIGRTKKKSPNTPVRMRARSVLPRSIRISGRRSV